MTGTPTNDESFQRPLGGSERTTTSLLLHLSSRTRLIDLRSLVMFLVASQQLRRSTLRSHTLQEEKKRFIMGSVFGRESVAEPPFSVELSRANADFPYELRRYKERFAAEAEYPAGGSDDGTPFRLLAKYIGVFGTPENEGSQAISMTAPVVKEEKKGTPIAMTAPVSMQEENGKKTMQFILPKEFDSMDKIPKPTNPAVHIVEIPPAVGAVHRFSGSDISMQKGKQMADALVEQLGKDGVDLSNMNVMQELQVWGYNPPWTIPFLRRNEVWLPLTEEQVSKLVNEFDPSATN